jgi:hypothetical protein
MASDPEPEQAFWNFYGKRPIVKTNANGPVLANLLEMQ